MRTLVASFSVLALTAGACTDDESDPPQDSPSTLELSMQTTIPAGAEVEYCQFIKVPETWVTKDAVKFTTGSHHVLVYQTDYTTIPTHKDDGTPVDTSGVFDCSDGATNGWSITKLAGGSQNANGDSMLRFPEGIGIKIGGVLLMNVHYRNASDVDLATDVKVTFDTTTQDRIEQEGDLLFLYNPLIAVPAGGTSRAHWTCPVYADITIANVQSHMHSRGVGYSARIDGGEPFYVNDKWEGVPVKDYESFTVKAGSRLDYYCDYRNTTGSAIYQGPRTTDEMCMLIGSYYPRDMRTSLCLDAAGQVPGGDWVGSGTATCAQTMGCLQTANSLELITSCMMQATPAVSRVSSELLRCFMTSQNPGADCGPQTQACAAQ